MSAHLDDLSGFVREPAKPKQTSRRAFTLVELLVVIGIIAILFALFLPFTRSGGSASRRAQCGNNLKQIGLGLINYESAYNAFPPAYTVDASGRPLHSWRTLILPFMEQSPLYQAIDLSKPWDDPVNATAHATVINTYCCPSQISPTGTTPYLAVVAPGSCFLPTQSRRLTEITDDRGATLMVIEAASDQAVHWMAPLDADEALVTGFGPGSKLNHAGGVNAAFANGSTRFLHAKTPAAQRRAMISIAGHDDEAAGH